MKLKSESWERDINRSSIASGWKLIAHILGVKSTTKIPHRDYSCEGLEFLAYLSLSLVCQQRCWDFPLAKQTFSQNTKHRKGCAAAPSKGNSNNFHIFHRVLASIIATASSQPWPNMGFSRWLRGKFTINKGKSRKKVFTFARENNEETSRSWISNWFVTFLTQLHRTCYLHLNSRSSWSLMDFLWLSPEPCYHLKHFNFAFNSSLFLALWFNQSVCFSLTAVYLTFS